MLRETWQHLGDLADRLAAAHARIDELQHEVLAIGDERHALALQREQDRQREAELVARLQAQEGQLARLEREASELAGTLEVIRTSAIMRATAPMRRVYYRLRGRLRLG